MDNKETGICCICGKLYTNYGNNALPLKDGRCCNVCNLQYVVPARINNLQKGKDVYSK